MSSATDNSTLSLHDALPISEFQHVDSASHGEFCNFRQRFVKVFQECRAAVGAAFLKKDRKSTRLNSSHVAISYAVFCLKKKNVNSDAGVNPGCGNTAYRFAM